MSPLSKKQKRKERKRSSGPSTGSQQAPPPGNEGQHSASPSTGQGGSEPAGKGKGKEIEIETPQDELLRVEEESVELGEVAGSAGPTVDLQDLGSAETLPLPDVDSPEIAPSPDLPDVDASPSLDVDSLEISEDVVSSDQRSSDLSPNSPGERDPPEGMSTSPPPRTSSPLSQLPAAGHRLILTRLLYFNMLSLYDHEFHTCHLFRSKPWLQSDYAIPDRAVQNLVPYLCCSVSALLCWRAHRTAIVAEVVKLIRVRVLTDYVNTTNSLRPPSMQQDAQFVWLIQAGNALRNLSLGRSVPTATPEPEDQRTTIIRRLVQQCAAEAYTANSRTATEAEGPHRSTTSRAALDAGMNGWLSTFTQVEKAWEKQKAVLLLRVAEGVLAEVDAQYVAIRRTWRRWGLLRPGDLFKPEMEEAEEAFVRILKLRRGLRWCVRKAQLEPDCEDARTFRWYMAEFDISPWGDMNGVTYR
ncbi:hypothetical protein FN846DRAFT_187932 [Sphaerosporella brunnea]|uniref:Uncharacterized protein n=1 Tax=Sphaerosporella brunnea TaxID=1250544 RepID=A0A5J5ER55_9PEZI|nr:hypothetical protein FN846DRAFT_187932 [Sphaerosporella brunnea]